MVAYLGAISDPDLWYTVVEYGYAPCSPVIIVLLLLPHYCTATALPLNRSYCGVDMDNVLPANANAEC